MRVDREAEKAGTLRRTRASRQAWSHGLSGERLENPHERNWKGVRMGYEMYDAYEYAESISMYSFPSGSHTLCTRIRISWTLSTSSLR